VAVESGWAAQVGNDAPEFELPALLSGVKGRLRLRDELKTQNVVLAFYPGNWDTVSTQQMLEYQVQREQFERQSAKVIAICVDSIMNTTVWERAIGPLDFALCSDFWPHGTVSQAYGVFRREGPNAGKSERAIVVVDRSGRIAFRKTYGDSELPSIADTWRALRPAA
jgi:mycoredoxin-dependent peroxiredoxin